MWFLLAALFLQAGPQSSNEPASIEGFVYSASGDPLKRAQVYLTRSDAAKPPRSTNTNSAGRYSFSDLEPGTYYLVAERDGFVRQEFGQRAPGRPPRALSLGAGLRLQDINFKLLPTGVIAGRVLNEDGEKLANASVMALRQSVTRGRKDYVTVNTVTTNDLGDYRLFGLSPGRYYVVSFYTRNSRTGLIYPPLCYPNAPDVARAAAIDVAAGGEVTGIDFQLSSAHTVTVRGRAVARTGNSGVLGGSVMLTPREGLRVFGGVAAQLNADGTFEFHNVAPGAYLLVGQANNEGKSYSGRVPLDVGDQALENVGLTLLPAMPLSGRIRFEGNVENPPIGMHVMAENPDTGMGGRGSVDAKLAFTIDGLSPMNYWIDVRGLPQDFYVRSVSTGQEELVDKGVNLTNGPVGNLEVVLSPKAARVEGSVMRDGNPFANATVVLVPEGPRRNRSRFYKFATTDSAGRFALHSIVPGDYKLFAWEYIPGGNFEDPEFLAKHEARGKSVALRESSRESVPLTLIGDEEGR